MSVPKFEDVNILSNYYDKIENDRMSWTFFPDSSLHHKSDKRILGILKSKNESKLVILQKDDITCINRIKSIFGCGPLAHINYKLKAVEQYLCSFEWKNLKTSLEEHSQNAFKCVCAVANCAARCNVNSKLFDAVSEDVKVQDISFKVNCESEGRDLGNQIQKYINKLLLEEYSITFRFAPSARRQREWEKHSLTKLNELLRESDQKLYTSIPLYTQVKLKSEETLNWHAFLPKNLKDTIEAIEFIFRYSSESDLKGLHEQSMLIINTPLTFKITCKHEKYKTISKEEGEFNL